MKDLSVALIVVSLVVADWMAEYHQLSSRSQHVWSVVDSIFLVLAALWFWHRRNHV